MNQRPSSKQAAALLWQSRWSPFSEAQPLVRPDPSVWIRISNQLGVENASPREVAKREELDPKPLA